MRILLTADWHCCPPPLSGLDRAREWRDVAQSLAERAREIHPDVIVVAGDLWDRSRPSPAEIKDVVELLTLLGCVAQVVCIPGTPSHDGDGPDRLGPTGILSAIDIPRVGVICSPLVVTLPGLTIAGIPGASKSWLANTEEGRGASPVALHQAMSARLADVIRGLAAEAAQHNLPAILVGHLSVDGCVASSDESIRMTSEPVLARDSFPDVFQAVCLGHIHKPQVIQYGPCGPWIGYPGSFLRANWGEEKDDRGFWVLDLQAGQVAETEFHTLPATNLVTVEVDARAEAAPAVSICDAVDLSFRHTAGGIVRVRARLTEQQARLMDWPLIEDHARELGAILHWCPPIVEVERITRTRGDGISTAMGPLQALGAYIEATPALAQDRDGLLVRARTQEGVAGDG